jgi:hypothetical protein
MLFQDFGKVAAKLEQFLSDWSDGSDESDSDEDAPKKGLPEKTKRKLLDRPWMTAVAP